MRAVRILAEAAARTTAGTKQSERSEEVFEHLRGALDDEDTDIRAVAALSLGERGVLVAFDELLRMIVDGDHDVQASEVLAQSPSWHEAALDTIGALLNDDRTQEQRARLVQALAEFEDSDELLLVLLDDPTPVVALTAKAIVRTRGNMPDVNADGQINTSAAAKGLAAPAVMAVSGASLYAGAAIAVGLFENFSPVIVAWFRVAAAGVILLILNRPKLRAFGGVAGRNAAIYGVMTMAMNMAFYQSLNHIPMGTAVAIEFLGPVVVAAWGSRRACDWIALFFAAAGVLVISGATWSDNAVGIMWALAAGLFWAGYILISSHIAADKENSRASMAVGFSYAGLLALPVMLLIWPEDPGLPGITVLGLAAGLGLLSAAIPYSLDQVVLRMAGSSYFALLQAILPVVAAIVGALALGQWLTTAEIIGIVLIIIAVGLRRN